MFLMGVSCQGVIFVFAVKTNNLLVFFVFATARSTIFFLLSFPLQLLNSYLVEKIEFGGVIQALHKCWIISNY